MINNYIMATTQNISMTDELAQFVTQQVKSGDFASVSEVYREAIRGFRDKVQEKNLYMESLKAELKKGLDDSTAGRMTEIDNKEELSQFFRNIEDKVQKTREC